jgi:hypothetical protein
MDAAGAARAQPIACVPHDKIDGDVITGTRDRH